MVNNKGRDNAPVLPARRAARERPVECRRHQMYVKNIHVTNGTAEIGFFSNDPSGNNSLLYADDVTFYKQ